MSSSISFLILKLGRFHDMSAEWANLLPVGCIDLVVVFFVFCSFLLCVVFGAAVSVDKYPSQFDGNQRTTHLHRQHLMEKTNKKMESFGLACVKDTMLRVCCPWLLALLSSMRLRSIMVRVTRPHARLANDTYIWKDGDKMTHLSCFSLAVCLRL